MGFFIQTASGHLSEWHPTLESALSYGNYLKMIGVEYILIDCRTNSPVP